MASFIHVFISSVERSGRSRVKQSSSGSNRQFVISSANNAEQRDRAGLFSSCWSLAELINRFSSWVRGQACSTWGGEPASSWGSSTVYGWSHYMESLTSVVDFFVSHYIWLSGMVAHERSVFPKTVNCPFNTPGMPGREEFSFLLSAGGCR